MRIWIIVFHFVIHLSAAVSCSADSGTAQLKFLPGKQVGRVETELIKEASGIVASRKNPGILWVHNDSGDSARVYALNTAGKLLRTCRIEGAFCRDWEDIAIGPGPDKQHDYLYIGDIGDNKAKYPSITIYRVPEPRVDPNSVLMDMQIGPAEVIEFVYPDGPKDAETLMVDPLNCDIYIVSKRKLFSRVYRAASAELTKKPVHLSQVAVLPWAMAVGGDISADGKFVIIRSLSHASIWIRPKKKPLWQVFSRRPTDIKLMLEPQGEAICFDADGRGFFTISEKAHQPIYYYAKLDEAKKQDN